jgi:hypothetical protein
MEFAKITFSNPHTGSIKIAPVGFSWTTLFFGPFPAFMRGHVSYGLVITLLAMITAGLSTIVFAYFSKCIWDVGGMRRPVTLG